MSHRLISVSALLLGWQTGPGGRENCIKSSVVYLYLSVCADYLWIQWCVCAQSQSERKVRAAVINQNCLFLHLLTQCQWAQFQLLLLWIFHIQLRQRDVPLVRFYLWILNNVLHYLLCLTTTKKLAYFYWQHSSNLVYFQFSFWFLCNLVWLFQLFSAVVQLLPSKVHFYRKCFSGYQWNWMSA